MHKTALFVLALGTALLFLVSAFGGQKEAIARAQAAAQHLQLQRDSLAGEIARREMQQAALEQERALREAAVGRLRDSVQSLERRRRDNQLTVRSIRTVGTLQHQLRTTFPELGERGWGVSTVPLDASDTLGLEYLMVPAWFAETFAIDHANAESWRAQKDRLRAVDSLQLIVSALQDSVTTLVEANGEAYQAGYDAAYAGYQDITRRYVAELKKPRIDFPAPIGLLGAAAVGFVIGTVIR